MTISIFVLRRRTQLSVLGILLWAAVHSAPAQTADAWQATTIGTWNTGGNWSVGIPNNTDNANFTSTGLTAVDLGSGGTAQQITFTGAAQAYTFSNGNLTLDANTTLITQFNVLDTSGETNTATQTFNNLVVVENTAATTAFFDGINLKTATTLNLAGGLNLVASGSSSNKFAFSTSGTTVGGIVNIGGASDFGTTTATDIQFTGYNSTYNLTGTIASGDVGNLDVRPAFVSGGGGSTHFSDTLNLSNSIGNMTLNEGSGSTTGFRVMTINFVGQNMSFNTSNAITLDQSDSGNSAAAFGVAAIAANYTGSGSSVDTVAGAVTLSPLTYFTSNAFNAAANNTLVLTGQIKTKAGAGTTVSNLLINGTASTTGVLSSSGSGTVIFGGSAASTYTTPTIVAGGTFLANATTTSTGVSSVQVGIAGGSTATMGGIGLVAPTATAASTINILSTGVLAPGGSGGIAGTSTYGSPTGTLTIKAPTSAAAGFVNFATGAQLSINLNSGVTNNQLSLTSDFSNEVTFNNNVINFTDLSGGTLSAGTYNLITDASASNGTYSGLGLTGSTITSGLSIGTGLSSYTGYSESLLLNGGVIQLSVTAVPEPAAWTLMLGGFIFLVFTFHLCRRKV